jgi:hypothetical protein
MQLASAAAAVEQHAVLHVAGLAHHALALQAVPGLATAWQALDPSR